MTTMKLKLKIVTSDPDLKKNLIQKNLIASPQNLSELKITENQQKMSKLFMLEPETPAPPVPAKAKKKLIIIKKRRKKAQKIEVNFQENKVDINTNSTENEQKIMPKIKFSKKELNKMGLRLKEKQARESMMCEDSRTLDRELAIDVKIAACRRATFEEIMSLPRAEEAVPVLNPEEEPEPLPLVMTVVRKCEGRVWRPGVAHARCPCNAQDEPFFATRDQNPEEAIYLCKTHGKPQEKIVKKPVVGRFMTSQKSEVHGVIGQSWSCLPVIKLKDGTDYIAPENLRFNIHDCPEIAEDFVPWMKGAKSIEDKLYLKNQKKLFKKAYKLHLQKCHEDNL